ncbi:uncharacterized protein LOC144771527 isoform X2 [Lissotriton helveticus]
MEGSIRAGVSNLFCNELSVKPTVVCLGSHSSEGESTPPAKQTEPLFNDDEEDFHTIIPDALQQLMDTLSTSPPGAGQLSCIEETPPPAQTTHQEAPTTTAFSQDHRDNTWHSNAVCQEKMAVQVQLHLLFYQHGRK